MISGTHPWTPEEAITFYLSFNLSQSGRPYSALAHAFSQCRSSTNRNVISGVRIPGLNHGNWNGALGYTAILDQIGDVVRRRTDPVDQNTPGVLKALRRFSSIDTNEPDIRAIYALRSSFAHEFGLTNIRRDRRVNIDLAGTFAFRVTEGSSQLITHADTQWDGDYGNININTTTIVDLACLGDLVEEIYYILVRLNTSGDLILNISPEELIQRFAFFS